ncbi:MAG TPA: DUF2232 domain-containing protein, partial [Rectinemataceae bacterium]|nr:DUF2232 domain-containing protein [Rectinemataceae bacterium]
AVQLVRLAGEAALGVSAVIAVLLPPLVLVSALMLLNAPFWERGMGPYRAFIVAGMVSLIAAPGFASLMHDKAIMGYFEERIASFIAPLKAESTTSGYDASALAASLDPKLLAESALHILSSCYATLILLMLGGSRWLGNRISGRAAEGRKASPPLAEYRLPYVFLWPFLIAWAGVAASILLKAADLYQAVAWNLALLLSMGYAAQGLGIASHIFTRWHMPRTLRFAILLAVIITIATPTVGVIIAILIPLLGVTEVWIPYRNPKGVGA